MTPRDPWYPGGQRDASLWVEEFFRIYPNGCGDADTMLGWFANAIETGVMFGKREAAPDPAPLDVERLALALLTDGLWPVYDPTAPNGYRGGPFDMDHRKYAAAIAREYAALASEDRP